jgi:hypothetical protein
MDLLTGWTKALYKDRKTGEKITYYFNKEGASSLVPPPPLSDADDSDASWVEGTTNRPSKSDLRAHLPQPPPT